MSENIMNVKMKGMDEQYIVMLQEHTSICDATAEFGDNAIDAKATEVKYTYDGDRLVVADNGKGMVDKLEDFATNYKTHLSVGDNTIGIKGVGGKDAILRISDYFGKGSVVTIITSNGTRTRRLTWVLSKKEHQINDISICDMDEVMPSGTTITITNPLVDNRILAKVENGFSYTYSYKIQFEGIKILFNTTSAKGSLHEIKPNDEFCLKKLIGEHGEFAHRLNENCEHYEDGVFFVVRQNKFQNASHEVINVPNILIYIADEKLANMEGTEKDAYCGQKFGALYNGRYITNSSSSIKVHYPTCTNTGGTWRIRNIVIISSHKAYELFSGKSNKSKGILPIQKNERLEDYKIAIPEGSTMKEVYMERDKKTNKKTPKNICQSLTLQYGWMTSFNIKRRETELTLDILRGILQKKPVNKVVKEDTKSYEISSLEEWSKLPQREQGIFCVFEKTLKSHNLTDKKIYDIIKEALPKVAES